MCEMTSVDGFVVAVFKSVSMFCHKLVSGQQHAALMHQYWVTHTLGQYLFKHTGAGKAYWEQMV